MTWLQIIGVCFAAVAGLSIGYWMHRVDERLDDLERERRGSK